ncbi:MAG: hypothetical protein KJ077_11310 [Anaerolineae bacterium]|nr:hypothetical protein [Anaerolineae bacterium]
MRYEIIHADIRDFIEDYAGPLFHFIAGDWPYNLDTIIRRFGKENSAPARFGRDGSFQRHSAGFLGHVWDTDVAYKAKTWRGLARLAHPGAFTASFTHPRTQHRLALAQEAARYLLAPTFYNQHAGEVLELPFQLGWIYGSGQPKGTVIPGVEGWQYGRGVFRPEIEPIILAQTPLPKNRRRGIAETGAGVVNVGYGQANKVNGRWAGNLILTHHPNCRLTGTKQVKNESGSVDGDEPSLPWEGDVFYDKGVKRQPFERKGGENGIETVPQYFCHPDCAAGHFESEHGKSHYFYQADWNYEIFERLAHADPTFYAGKVSKLERNAGLSHMPDLVRRRVNSGGLEREPRFAPTIQKNNHPTLKSIKLTKWLTGLFLPHPQYSPRRALICCGGTGSEAIGALLAGWDEVVVVESHKPYVEICEPRMAWWSEFIRWGQTDVDAILAVAAEEQKAAKNGHLNLQPRMF